MPVFNNWTVSSHFSVWLKQTLSNEWTNTCFLQWHQQGSVVEKDSDVYLPFMYQEVGLDWASSLEREQILQQKQVS